MQLNSKRAARDVAKLDGVLEVTRKKNSVQVKVESAVKPYFEGVVNSKKDRRAFVEACALHIRKYRANA